MTVKRFGRRMFLGAAGGGLIAMPWLPSILGAQDGISDLKLLLLQLDEDGPRSQVFQSSDGRVVVVEAREKGLVWY